MITIGDGIRRFTQFSAEKQMEFNGWYVSDGRDALLIDPVAMSEADRAELGALVPQPTRIAITNKDHRRAAPELARGLGIEVAVHALDAPLFDAPVDRAYQDGDRLGFLTVVHLSDQKSPGESALYWRERGVLFLGDAVIGKPAGALAMPPIEKLPDAARAKQSLQRLLEIGPVEQLLLGDGEPILSGARELLRAFLAEARHLPKPAPSAAVRGC